MNNKRKRLFVIVFSFLLFIFSALNLLSISLGASIAIPVVKAPVLDYTAVIDSLNMTAVQEHVTFLSNLETRATGTVGNDIAAQYIYQKFKEYGLKNVFFHNFTVPVVVDLGANVTILEKNETIRLYPVVPNLVCPSTTPREGISGQLIYAGDGYIWSFDGKPVNGSIVLMDWLSRDRWINAAKLGAKAVIFLPPPAFLIDKNLMSLEGYVAEKYLPFVPFNFPRFYVNETGADALLDSLGKEVHLVSTQRWKNVESRNVIGFIEGLETKQIYQFNGQNYTINSGVLLSAHYDSFSVCPSFAPGAQEATGVASLLEIARYYAKPENKPRNSLFFVAFGGHGQNAYGSYAFTRDFLSWMTRYGEPRYGTQETIEIGDQITWNINLDFGTGSNIIKVSDQDYINGIATSQPDIFQPYWDRASPLIRGIVQGLNAEKPHGKTYRVIYGTKIDNSVLDIQSLSWDIRDQLYRTIPFGHEWLTAAGRMAFTISEAYNARPLWRTPFDTLDRVDFTNLKILLEAASVIIKGFVNYEDIIGLYIDKNNPKWIENLISYREADIGIRGKQAAWLDPVGVTVARWNETEAWYTPVSEAIVYFARAGTTLPYNGPYLFTYDGYVRMYAVSNELGWAEFVSRHWLPGGAEYIWAFEVDEETGNLLSAPEMGLHKWSLVVPGGRTRYLGFLAIFNCSTLVFFEEGISRGLEGPYEISLSSAGPLFSGPWPASRKQSVFVFPVPADEKIVFLGGGAYPTAILKNNSKAFITERGDQIIVPMTALRYAEEFYKLNEERFKSLSAVDPTILSSPEYARHLKTEALIQEANFALSQYRYSKADAAATLAFTLSQNVYGFVRSRMQDAAASIPYLAIFFVPFVFYAQKLLFAEYRKMKRVLAFSLLFALLTFTFYLLHPGFIFASNPLIIVLGLALFVLALPVPYFISTYILDFLRSIRLKYLGKHELNVTAFTGAMEAFFTGIEQMRRYRSRSAFTLITIVLVVSAIVNLTALEPRETLRGNVWAGKPSYQGLYIRQESWGYADGNIPDMVANYIVGTVGRENVTIAPRAWRYHIAPNEGVLIPPEAQLRFKLIRNERIIYATVLWGVSPEDFEVKLYLTDGRWFLPGERGVIILSETQAEGLRINATEVNLGKTYNVLLDNMNHTVIGIVSDGLELAQGFDREWITPLKRDIVHSWTTHHPLDEVFILPYEEVIDLGGETRSLSVEFKDSSIIDEIAIDILWLPLGGIPYHIYAGVGEETRYYVRGQFLVTWGIQNVIAPATIAFFSILNVLIGTVMERKKHIATYSTIGLSPIHTSFMFLAESIIYGLFGGVLGYLLSLFIARFGSIFLPGIPFNFSSRYVLIAMGGGMLTCIAATIYPAILASRLVTPSLERKWKVPSGPQGDIWEIPFPVYFHEKREAEGIISFLKEYFDAHRGIDAPDFYVIEDSIAEGEMRGNLYLALTSDVRLFPYDEGIRQTSSIYIVEIEPKRWQARIVMNRKEGEASRWRQLNSNYLDIIRKQLLLWRSVEPEEREKYIESHKELSNKPSSIMEP